MTPQRFAALQWLAVLSATLALLYLLSPILTPFVAAAILAYIGNPLVGRLCGWGWSRTLATVAVMLGWVALLAGLLLVMLPLLQQEVALLLARVPDWIELLRQRWLPQLLGDDGQADSAALREWLVGHWQSAGGVAGKLLPWLGDGSSALFGLLMNLLLTPVVLFYLLRDWEVLLEKLRELTPLRRKESVREVAIEVDGVLAEFLRGQLSVMLLMSVYYVCALWLAGLEFALPIGLLAGMLVFVPYLGMVAGLALATLAALSQFDSFSGVVIVWAAFGIGQLLEGMVVTPWLVGERIGLHPLAVIFALLAFGQLFGFFGVLLALPLSAVLLVALRHARDSYLSSPLYRD
ncbi:MAG: AI-2E family transporter [Nitrosomonadales bacterium]|nr:AI-2E family transporter [Nitrosomonadales bacterium]